MPARHEFVYSGFDLITGRFLPVSGAAGTIDCYIWQFIFIFVHTNLQSTCKKL